MRRPPLDLASTDPCEREAILNRLVTLYIEFEDLTAWDRSQHASLVADRRLAEHFLPRDQFGRDN